MRLALTVLGFLVALPAHAGIELDILAWPEQLKQEQQPIQVRVVSSVLLDTVQATLHGQTITLSANAVNQAEGVFDTSMMPSGPATVRVTARDVQGNEASREATGVIDRPPRLEGVHPRARLTTARPDVHVQARCSDDNGCQVRVVIYRLGQLAGHELYSWQGAEVDQTANVAQADGEVLEVRYEASDERGQKSVASRYVAVERSPFLRPLVRVEGDIKDFDGTTLLVAGFEGGWSTQTLSSSPVKAGALVEQCAYELPAPLVYQSDPRCRPAEGRLTSFGVLVVGSSSTSNPGPVQLWHTDGGVTALGRGSAPLHVMGTQAAWCCSLAELSTGQTVSFPDDVTGYTLTGDGRLLFTQRGLWRQTLSGRTRLADAVGTSAFLPVGDSVRTAWVTSVADRDQLATLQLLDSSGERDAGRVSGIKHGVQANNGWLAYVRNVGSQEIPNIFRLAPDGGETQLTQWGIPNTVETLNANGELSYFHGSLNENDYRTKRALIWQDNQTFDIGGKAGELIWRGGAWYLVLGDTLFILERDGGVTEELPVSTPDAGSTGTDGGTTPAQRPACGCSTDSSLGFAIVMVLVLLSRALRLTSEADGQHKQPRERRV